MKLAAGSGPRLAAALGLLVALSTVPAPAAVRVNGSTTVNPVVVDAAKALLRSDGLQIQIDTLGGSSGGLAALGEHRVEVAMSSRPILDSDRERYSAVDFQATAIGRDAVALVVSKDVWDAGVHALSRQQVQALYEGRIGNWSQLGGPDRRVAFFNKEPGRGTWEVFARWLYGSGEAAPLVALPEIGSNEEARSKVAASRGAISQLSAAWVDGVRVFALALSGPDGTVYPPSPGTTAGTGVADGQGNAGYPMSRNLLLVTDGPPRGESRRLIDFLLSPDGQALVAKHGYLPVRPVGN